MKFIAGKINIFLLIVFLFASFSFVPAAVHAGNLRDAFGDNLTDVAGPAGAGYRTDAEPETLVGTVITVILSFLGVVFLVLMIYGGFLWMTARGNEQQVEKAKNLIIAAITGLIIVMAAYAISYLLVSELGSKTLEGIESAP